jgi:hypothetical protein
MIAKWILILTITQGSSYGSAAIETVEFDGKQACLAAGTEWLNQRRASANYRASALCVPKGSK